MKNNTLKNIIFSLIVLFSLCSCNSNKLTPEPSVSKEPSLSIEPSITPTSSLEPTPSITDIPSPSDEPTPSPTLEPSPTITSTPTDSVEYSKDILFTEMNTNKTVLSNRAFEISNIGDSDIDLSNYSVDVYRRSSLIATENIPLVGTLKAHSSYIVCYSYASEEIKDKSDLIVDNYLNDGTFPIGLKYKDTLIDAIGIIGFSYNFAEQSALVRKSNHLYQETDFNKYHWVRYPINEINTLGNYESISDEELLNGPHLEEDVLEKEFALSPSLGGGGVIEVTIVGYSDGDTTRFNYGNKYRDYDIYGSNSTRYYGINTPEIAHSADEVADPYGNEARDFTNSLLKKAKHVLIQSIEQGNVRETYSRMLGYVWITDLDNPSIGDYQLLNYLIVKNGFSLVAFADHLNITNNYASYNGINFIDYMYDAENYANMNHLNIHEGAFIDE